MGGGGTLTAPLKLRRSVGENGHSSLCSVDFLERFLANCPSVGIFMQPHGENLGVLMIFDILTMLFKLGASPFQKVLSGVLPQLIFPCP